MKNKINISIPQPCHENWEAMSATEKGRFCNSCQKNVYDFTSSSDREINNAFKANPNICGRFDSSQLNRDLIIPKEKSPIWLATSAALISFISIGTQEVFAQGEVKIELTDKKIIPDLAKSINDKLEISGFAVDINDKPLPNLEIYNNQKKIAITDVDGKFCIYVSNCDEIFFSGDEYEYPYIIDGPISNTKIIIEKITPKKKSITGYCDWYEKKRTFFGRVFHSIGNWFR